MIRASLPDTSFVEQMGLSVSTDMISLMSSLSYEEVKARSADFVTNEFIDAFSWSGTPDDVANNVAAVIDEGFSNICIVPHAPRGSSVMKVIHSFSQDVLPRIRSLMT